MSPVRWLVMAGWQAWLWSLGAQDRQAPPSRVRPAAEAFTLTGHDSWYCRMLERGAPRPAAPAAGAGRRPVRGGARGAAAIQGARGLVLEVRRIPLDYANGTPVGTYR